MNDVEGYVKTYGESRRELIATTVEFMDAHKIPPAKRNKFVKGVMSRAPLKGVGFDPILILSILDVVYKLLFGGDPMQIQLTSPVDGAKIKSGSAGSVVITVTQQSFFDFVQNGEAVIRDNNGLLIWQGSANFSSGSAVINLTFPVPVGSYSIEAKALGLLKYVNAATKGNFEVI